MKYEELLMALKNDGWRARVFETGEGLDVLDVRSRNGAFFQAELNELQDVLDFYLGDTWDVRVVPKAGVPVVQFELGG